MSKQLTRSSNLMAPHIDYVVVDGSGSMFGYGGDSNVRMTKWDACISALDAYIDTLVGANLNAQIITSVFSGEPENIQRDCRLSDWVPFTHDPLEAPGGNSPLFDAINCMGRHLRDLNPADGACSIVLMTDGEANANRFTDETQARAILDWCRAKGWSVTFIGCDFENSTQARQLGADRQNSISVQKSKMKDAGKLLAAKRIYYAAGGNMDFTDDEKTKFGGYLAAPEAK